MNYKNDEELVTYLNAQLEAMLANKTDNATQEPTKVYFKPAERVPEISSQVSTIVPEEILEDTQSEVAKPTVSEILKPIIEDSINNLTPVKVHINTQGDTPISESIHVSNSSANTNNTAEYKPETYEYQSKEDLNIGIQTKFSEAIEQKRPTKVYFKPQNSRDKQLEIIEEVADKRVTELFKNNSKEAQESGLKTTKQLCASSIKPSGQHLVPTDSVQTEPRDGRFNEIFIWGTIAGMSASEYAKIFNRSKSQIQTAGERNNILGEDINENRNTR